MDTCVEEFAHPVVSVQKRSFIQQLFTQLAPRYDWFNRLVSGGLDQRWRRIALQRGEVLSTHRVLDVCTGTGDLAILCHARQRGQGLVVGADMTPAMLLRAKQKQPSIAWLQADALSLPFASASFDRVTIGFSTRNLSDLMAGLRELVRVLKPGGRLIILETGRPANPLVRAGYFLFLFTVARVIGLVLTGRLWPFTYLAESVRHFRTPAQLIEDLQCARTTVEYVPLAGGLASLFVAAK